LTALKNQYLARMRAIKKDLNALRGEYEDGHSNLDGFAAASRLRYLGQRLSYLAENMRDGVSDACERWIR